MKDSESEIRLLVNCHKNYLQLLYRETFPRFPKTNFAYNTSRVQRGMFGMQNWSMEPMAKYNF